MVRKTMTLSAAQDTSRFFSSSLSSEPRNPMKPTSPQKQLTLKEGRTILLKEPKSCNILVGKLIRAIRMTKPRHEGYRGGRRKNMTQDELRDQLFSVCYANNLSIPAFSISALERGLVRVEKHIIECLACALDATDAERACLLEAGGYSGFAELIASTRGDLQIHFASQLEKVSEGEIKDADLSELLRLINAALEIECQPSRLTNPAAPESADSGGSA
jgi:hypothetical protein